MLKKVLIVLIFIIFIVVLLWVFDPIIHSFDKNILDLNDENNFVVYEQ